MNRNKGAHYESLMKIEIRELEIELIAENSHEQDALVRLLRHKTIGVEYGKSRDRDYPPDPHKTNVILKFPNPNDWGT